MKTKTPSYKQISLVLILLILGIALLCLIWIFSKGTTLESSTITADIYQDGQLLHSIPLNQVTSNYTLLITGENNCSNEIEIRPGSIGMISASCPDKLCVHQGFIDSTLIPITCLPNRLVIQLRRDDSTSDNTTPDIMGY